MGPKAWILGHLDHFSAENEDKYLYFLSAIYISREMQIMLIN